MLLVEAVPHTSGSAFLLSLFLAVRSLIFFHPSFLFPFLWPKPHLGGVSFWALHLLFFPSQNSTNVRLLVGLYFHFDLLLPAHIFHRLVNSFQFNRYCSLISGVTKGVEMFAAGTTSCHSWGRNSPLRSNPFSNLGNLKSLSFSKYAWPKLKEIN